MPFVPFHRFYPELAAREVRTLKLFDPTERAPVDELPPGEYAMFEMYCDEPGCDCRRVFFTVMSSYSKQPVAVVAYGWEDLKFYARWAKFGGRAMAKELQGPVLNMSSPQSKFAPGVLRLVDEVLLADPAYIERLKRHYRLVREIVDHKAGLPPAERPDRRQRKRLLAQRLREIQAERSQKKRRVG